MTACEFVNPFDGERCARDFPHRHVYEHGERGPATWIEPLPEQMYPEPSVS